MASSELLRALVSRSPSEDAWGHTERAVKCLVPQMLAFLGVVCGPVDRLLPADTIFLVEHPLS